MLYSRECKHAGLFELDLTRSKPLKRKGLSKFYHKSRSFSSFDDILCTPHGESAAGLAKTPLMLYAWESAVQKGNIASDSRGGSAAVAFSSSLPSTAEELCRAMKITKLSQAASSLTRPAAPSAVHAQLGRHGTL
jgi:hypothetical protein